MQKIVEMELKKYALYYNNTNINAQSLPIMAQMWVEDFKDQIHTLALLPEAFKKARQLRADFMPKPKHIIEAYRDLVREKGADLAIKQIEHYEERNERYTPAAEEWKELKALIKNGYERV